VSSTKKWETIPHFGPVELKVEVRTVKHKRRTFTEKPTQETRPEILSLIEARAGELRKIEEASKKARSNSSTPRKLSHWCTSGPVCKICGTDYINVKLVKGRD
jgi:hypothetical protein